MLEALLGSTKGVSSAARRFRLRCLKSVILLLDASPDLEFNMGSGKEADETAMMTPQQKRQQVHANRTWHGNNQCNWRLLFTRPWWQSTVVICHNFRSACANVF